MRFEREQCLDLDAAFARTWLLADGRGASAAGCVLGCPASRHHGLLIAPAGPEGTPHVFLERLEEWLVDGERALPLSSARFPGVIEPSGHTYLASFDVWPTPTWRYLAGDVEVVRTLRMLGGPGHGVEVRWRVEGPQGTRFALRIRPFLACRPADALTQQNPAADPRVVRTPHGARFQPYASLPALEIEVRPGASLLAIPDWHVGYEHVQDAWSGRPAREDHLALATFDVPLKPRDEVTLRAWIGARPDLPWARGRGGGPRKAPALRTVLRAARARHERRPEGPRAFHVTTRLPWWDEALEPVWNLVPPWRPREASVTPWSEAWIRPRPEGSRSEAERGTRLRGFHVRVIEGARLALAGRRPAGREARADVAGAEHWIEQVFGAGPEATTAGVPALVADVPGATPERFDVALNARWLGLLRALSLRARPARRPLWRAALREAARTFRARFWLEDDGYLADAWVGGVPDRGVRPGMLVAAAEPAVPLSKAERLAIVERARVELLTPRGLRTLSPRDPAYDPDPGPRAPQAPRVRQGAVEPCWLLPYAQATLVARGRSQAVRARLRALVEGFTPHLSEHGLGTVAEVFDGEPPHRASGAPSDVRSLEALLEVLRLCGGGRA